jgi:hypothetical protein
MANIECKLFFSKRCGFCTKFIEGAWKDLKKLTSINNHNILYEEYENLPENKKLFTDYSIRSYPRTIIVGNNRRLQIIVGNSDINYCKKALEEGINTLFLDEKEWNIKEEIRIKKEKENLDKRKKMMEEKRKKQQIKSAQMKSTPSILDPIILEFLQKPDVIKQFNRFKVSKQRNKI